MFPTLIILILGLCIAYQSLLIGIIFIMSAYLIYHPVIGYIKNYPPGPWFGYLPFLIGNAVCNLSRLAKEYGNVYSLRIGETLIVVLNDYEIVKKYVNKPEFLGRSELIAADYLPGRGGFSVLHGKDWQEQRAGVMTVFKDLEHGHSPIEASIQEQVSEYIKYLDCLDSIGVYNNSELWSGMNNIITSIVFGANLKKNDPTRKLIDDAVNLGSRISNRIAIYGFLFPRFRNFFYRLWEDPFDKQITTLKQQVLKFLKIFKPRIEGNQIEEKKWSYLYRNIAETKALMNETNASIIFKNSLVGNILLLYLAGTETSRSTLQWFFLTMASYPEVQSRIQEEIDSHFEREQAPQWADRSKLPYTMAAIQEILRWRPVLPFGVLRRTEEDTNVEGYFVPKNTTIIINIHAIHHNPKYWKEPKAFNPERHLSSDGKKNIKSEAYIPFSYGRRNCPGITLAYMEIFLYVTALLQRFRIEAVLHELNFMEKFEVQGALPDDPKIGVVKFERRT